MNNPTQTLTGTPSKVVRRTCPKCQNTGETSEVICQDCGVTLQSVRQIRAIGIFLVVVGIGMLAFIGWLAVLIVNASQTGKSTYHGSPGQTAFIVFVGGLLILISLNATAAGIWQIVFGRRSKLLMITMAILGFGFIAAGFAAFLSR